MLTAQKQQKQIQYFATSSIQEEITIEYLRQWVNRNYRGNDQFLNWVKMVFRTDNFMSFYKYLRFPLISAKIVNDEIKPQLKRVFFADDSYFNYTVSKKETHDPEECNSGFFNNEFFDKILFEHNSVVVHDLDNINEPYREIINIDKVVAIDSEHGVIKRIAYLSDADVTESVFTSQIGTITGYSYVDDKEYIFYDKQYNILNRVPHDLGVCPADWISSENFSTDNDIVKKSILSYVKNDLEELVFLKTLQRMTEPNGAIPVVVKLKGNVVSKIGENIKGASGKEPMASSSVGSQQADTGNVLNGSESQLQAGSVINVPINKKTDGSIDSEITKNYFQFHYIPVESLNYLNERIQEIESNIIISVLGDYQEQNSSAKNELQVSKSYSNKEDKLRWLSAELSRIKKLSDFKLLALKYGKDNVQIDVFFGSDFFLETETDLYNNFAIAPNAIERRSILTRLAQVKNKFNHNKAKKEKILYKLMPYVSDKDFDTANAKGTIDPITFEYQTRFNYWITMFEASYGEINMFWDQLGDMKESEKLILINNLIKTIIKDETQPISNPPANI